MKKAKKSVVKSKAKSKRAKKSSNRARAKSAARTARKVSEKEVSKETQTIEDTNGQEIDLQQNEKFVEKGGKVGQGDRQEGGQESNASEPAKEKSKKEFSPSIMLSWLIA